MPQWKTYWIKAITPTIVFYLVCYLLVAYLFKVSPSGPCAPGMGVIATILLIPVVSFLILRNLFFGIKGSTTHLIRAGLHVLVCCSIILAANI